MLQQDLNLLHSWCETWKLFIHPEKSKIVHFGRTNQLYTYFWGTNTLTALNSITDLGIVVDSDLSFNCQNTEVVKKATMVSILISRTISSRSPEVYLKLFFSLVRPILEYAVEVWWPYLHKHIIAIEKVQRRFTKHIIGLNALSYRDRLQQLNIPSLWWRFQRGALITTFKILRFNYGGPSVKSNFEISINVRTRGHPWKLNRIPLNHTKTQNFFFHRIVPLWNDLPTIVVTADTVNSFKNRLDEHFKHRNDFRYFYLD